jgi:hypothetical protein
LTVIAAKVESFFRNSVLLHCGHWGGGEDSRTRVSNSLPQEVQAYSYMGMILMLPFQQTDLQQRSANDIRSRHQGDAAHKP